MPDATARLEVAVRPERRELVSAHLWAAGALGVLDGGDGLTAWFPAAGATAPVLDLHSPVPELLPTALHWSIEADRDWQAEWKATIAPVDAGRFTIVPTWLADGHRPRPDEETLVLDPGRAFGTGHHATTTLCLELLDDLDLGDALAGRAVADVGCGTGVLAIAAARRGASPVVGVDIDADAVAVSRANVAANDVDVELAIGSVGDLAGPADIVCANLVTDVVVQLADALVAHTRQALIVSGVASARRDLAAAALERAGARVDEVRTRDGWVALLARPLDTPDTPDTVEVAP
ncbi:MAG: 50S ribosomal protein L11 methyltransferase [Nitriliruptoraceae bacterium]|nr:50S ribosomal protein L11 methyltransferase [Nitriliruptoraceae bacterium]